MRRRAIADAPVRLRARAVAFLAAVAACAPSVVRAQQIVGGLHVGGPVRASLAAGAAWSFQSAAGREHGPFLLAEPGLGGHRASAGYLVMFGNLGSFASGRASWLQLRRDGDRREYAGFEVQVAPLFVMGVRVGAFVPLREGAGRDVLWMADFSLAL
jgi:hypothetical protein